jgi:hypothetical protein
VALIYFCTKSAQRIEVEVDGAIPNSASPKIGNEGFTQLV